MRAELIGHFEACMTDIYLHIDARMADNIRTHPYTRPLLRWNGASPPLLCGLSKSRRVVVVVGSSCVVLAEDEGTG